MLRYAVCMTVLLVLGAVPDARAEFYKWVDRDGREFITNEKEKIPVEYRASAKTVAVSDDRVSVSAPRQPQQERLVTSAEHKDKYGRGEQYWRKRANDLRRKVREQEDELDLLAKQEKDDEGATKRSAASRKKAKSARDKKKTKIEKKLAKLKRELDVDLPEEARKADAYPGWVRD